MAESEINVITIPQLASRLALREHQVRYIVGREGIEPVGQLGSANVYPVDVIERLERILRERAARQREAATT